MELLSTSFALEDMGLGPKTPARSYKTDSTLLAKRVCGIQWSDPPDKGETRRFGVRLPSQLLNPRLSAQCNIKRTQYYFGRSTTVTPRGVVAPAAAQVNGRSVNHRQFSPLELLAVPGATGAGSGPPPG